MPLSPGTSLGRYEVRSPIGAGGMGEVYLADDARLQRKVALKILPADFVANIERLRRFEQEARAASALNHPNILTIYEIGEEKGMHFIVTEFIEGETLRQLMASRRIALSETLDIALQLSSALSAAHAVGIIHRDVKPENIMVRRDRIVKVLDFGLVKLTRQYDTNTNDPTLIRSDTGIVKGTIAYMSPEQARGLDVDARTDVWSFGVVLYEMLARRLPFAGETTTDLLISIIQKEPFPLHLYAPETPTELAWIVAKMLRKNREERYQIIEDVQADLRRLKQRLDFEMELERAATTRELTERAQATGNEKSDDVYDAATVIEFTSALSQERPPNNFSEELTPLVGRQDETTTIETLLRRDDVRLITLTGVGGTGKTRLAQHVSREMLREFADGAFFIDLAPINDAELVASAIAQPLGVRESGSMSLNEALKGFLKDKLVLLILDNFEQVTSAAMLVKELLSFTQGLKMLVTSRAPLHLAAEHEFSVPPLSLPSTQRMPSADELMRYEAIAFFVVRAAAVKPAFTLTDENARAVTEICMRLDGLPLAIELAAARIKFLSPQAILIRLENQLKLLTRGARDLPARQQTMRNAISWSYELLEEDERKLLNQLSVFAGGCTLEATEEVCGVAGNLQIEILDGIASLVDKSLLVQREQADGEPRLRMLEVVREYALEKLEESGDADTVRDRHAHFYLALGERAEPELEDARAAEWLEQLEEEHDNLRATLRWLLEKDVEAGLRLCGAIFLFWTRRGYLTEGRGWIESALLKSEGASAQARAKALIGAGALTWSDRAAAHRFFDEALRVSRKAGDKRLVARSSNRLGALACIQGDFAAARKLIEKALGDYRVLGDTLGVGYSLTTLGELERQQGDLATASTLYKESVALFRRTGDQNGVSVNLNNLGAVACLEGDLEAAHTCYREAIEISRKMGDRAFVSISLDGFGTLLVARGEMVRAARLFGAAETLREEISFALEPTDREFRDRHISQACAAICDRVFTRAYEQGRALKMDEAIAHALEESTNT